MVMFGLLMVPVTYGVTHDLWMAVFVGGILMFGKQIAEGLNEIGDDTADSTGESSSNTQSLGELMDDGFDDNQSIEQEMGWE